MLREDMEGHSKKLERNEFSDLSQKSGDLGSENPFGNVIRAQGCPQRCPEIVQKNLGIQKTFQGGKEERQEGSKMAQKAWRPIWRLLGSILDEKATQERPNRGKRMANIVAVSHIISSSTYSECISIVIVWPVSVIFIVWCPKHSKNHHEGNV